MTMVCIPRQMPKQGAFRSRAKPERPDFFVGHMANLGVEVLRIDGSHVLGVLDLPDLHRAQFERLLIA